MKTKKRKNIKKKIVLVALILLITVCIFSACNTSSKNTYEFTDFESKIQHYANDLVKEYYVVDTQYKNLDFVTNGYTIEIKQEGNLLGGVALEEMPEFFEEINPEKPKMLTNSKVTKKKERLFSSAKEIVIQYVSQSSIIKDEDKQEVKNAISNMKLVAGKFDSEYAQYGMITYKDTIYINNDADFEVDEYIFVHELIHVINSVTAKGSKYEKSYLNHGGLSEGITDIIAATMIYWCDIDSKAIQKSKYLKYIDTAYVLMNNESFNLLEAYYYPDNYDKLIEMAGEDFVKCIFASVYALENNGYAWSNYLACNYYLQL